MISILLQISPKYKLSIVLDQPRKVLWTHVEVIYSMMWLIKPKTYKNN